MYNIYEIPSLYLPCWSCLLLYHLDGRAVGRSENPGVPVLFGGHNLPPSPLVEIGLTDLPKNGGAMAPPAPPGTTGLKCNEPWQTERVQSLEKVALTEK